jgi:hypothetical protein
VKRLAKSLAAFSLLLSVASILTCELGVRHEISKIPPERRAQMSDFDWIGDEWIALGMLIFLAAFLSAAVALSIWLIDRSRSKKARAGTN